MRWWTPRAGGALIALGVVLASLVAAAAPPGAARTTARAEPEPGAAASEALTSPGAYGRLPLSFERNGGQTDPQVQYLARGAGYTLFLTAQEAVLALRAPAGAGTSAADAAPGHAVPGDTSQGAGLPAAASDGAPTTLRLQLVGAQGAAPAVGETELPGKVNYLLGNDASQWRTDLPTYAQVRYP
jgi:hypothetical protein